MNQTPRIKLSEDQSGMASILITMISMIVIALIVAGFTQISLHEQRAALDKVLSTQALDAAESGVNDAQHTIEANIQSNTPIPAKTTCSGSDANYPSNPNLDPTHNIRYTCLLVDPQPLSLVYSSISDQSKIVQVQSINTMGPYNIQTLVLSWQDTTLPSSNFACSGNNYPYFPPMSGWNCSAGVIRMDIVPFNDPSSDRVVFLYPTASNTQNGYGTLDYADSSKNGSVIPAQCYSTNDAVTMPNMCNVAIYDLSTDNDGGYFIRLKALYGNQTVTITAPTGNNDAGAIQCIATAPHCNLFNFINDQVLVDSTGQAQDVLKRLQVRIPINPLDSNIVPNAAIQSTNSICKKFFAIPSTDTLVDTAPGDCSTNP